MRDSTAIRMHEADAKRASLLLGQFMFLQTRQEAFERVLRVSKWYDRLRWFFWPGDMLQVVDAVQMKLVDEQRRKMAEAASKSKIKVVRGSSLVSTVSGGGGKDA